MPQGQALKWKHRSRTRVIQSQFSLAANWGPAVLMDGGWSLAAAVGESSSKLTEKPEQAKTLTTKGSDLPLTQGSQQGWKLEPGGKRIGSGLFFSPEDWNNSFLFLLPGSLASS